MADSKTEGEETTARGADWEEVSLTASVYAAAPGPDPERIDPPDNNKDFNGNEESARTMFMSGHFIFPPIEHENLPLEPDDSEILTESGVQDVGPVETEEEIDIPDKTKEGNWNIESLSEADDLHGIQFFDKGKRVSVHKVDIEEGKTTLQSLDLVEKRECMFAGPEFSSFHPETYISGPVPNDESSDIAEPDDFLNKSSSSSPKPIKKHKFGGSGLPCDAWWKRRAASLYAHAKEASTFWSLCVAAALMGLVILGQRWQQERWQIQHLKSKLSINDEIASRILGRISQLKDALIGGHRRAPVIQDGSSTNR
uniref:1-deoxy-D-xylulose 5-phosphate reductoisomerase, chloroplastic n=1 Tax=Anthurium amnicola TaxID=1678845 RepID=A0A1D1Z633_9ARAE